MKVIAFIEPPQGAVVEKILRHCGLGIPHRRGPRRRELLTTRILGSGDSNPSPPGRSRSRTCASSCTIVASNSTFDGMLSFGLDHSVSDRLQGSRAELRRGCGRPIPWRPGSRGRMCGSCPLG